MNIYESIAAVMASIGAVGKDSTNQQQGFKFRGIDAVMNAVSPALIKHKLFIVPELLDLTTEDRTNSSGKVILHAIVKVKYTFYAEDGSNVSAIAPGEGMDTGDKAINKAMSAAYKYACFQTFCIPTEEMVDPDAECHEVQRKGAKKAEVKPETPKKEAPKEEAPKEPGVPDENAIINPVQLKSLKSRAAHDHVPESFITSLYKIKSLDQMTLRMYANLNNNWDRAVEMSNK